MIKSKGKEIPISIYKFYLHDSLTEIIEYLKPALECKTNTELFTKVLCHVYGEMRQFKDWQEQQALSNKEKSNE